MELYDIHMIAFQIEKIGRDLSLLLLLLCFSQSEFSISILIEATFLYILHVLLLTSDSCNITF